MEGDGTYRQRIGNIGEDTACRFLTSEGHTILERNWRSGHLEIDIISVDSEGIHFVEVKTRRNHIQAPPQDNVNTLKQRHIAVAAKRYLKTAKGNAFQNVECFFDVVAVTIIGKSITTEWFPQAYIPLYL